MNAPNQEYYYQFAAGKWIGTLTFDILDWRALIAGTSGVDFAAIVAVWAAGRTGKLVISAAMTPSPPELVSNNETWLSWNGPVFLPPVLIWHARGRFALLSDGVGVRITMFDEYGPISNLVTVTSHGGARIAPDAGSADYELTILGRKWSGHYKFDERRQSIDAQYTPIGASWGRIHYQATRSTGLAAPPSPPSADQNRVAEVGRAISELGTALRKRGHLLAVFCEVYADETSVIANELPNFSDPKWTADLVVAFFQRFSAAWIDHDQGRTTRTVWRPVFLALEERIMTDIDALALCIYVHIVGDLPRVLADTSTRASLGSRIDDFQRVNDILTVTLDGIKDDFCERFGSIYGLLDVLAGSYDDTFVDYEVSTLRGKAWYDACRLLSADPKARLETEREMEQRIKFFIDDLLDPTPAPLAAIASIARRAAAFFRKKRRGRQ